LCSDSSESRWKLLSEIPADESDAIIESVNEVSLSLHLKKRIGMAESVALES
jgi:hypothetical protein